MTQLELIEIARGGDSAAFYNSPTWRKKSKQVLRQWRNECQRCRARGKYTKASCVHHKEPLAESPGLAFNDDNLEPLCAGCHNEVHGKGAKRKPNENAFTNEERW